jgi:acyl carrier protein
MTPAENRGRKDRIIAKVANTFAELSGMDAGEIDPAATFLELGFDSLFLTQVSQALQSAFGVKITFRQLLDQLASIDALANYMDEQLPPEQMAEPAQPAVVAKPAVVAPAVTVPVSGATPAAE